MNRFAWLFVILAPAVGVLGLAETGRTEPGPTDLTSRMGRVEASIDRLDGAVDALRKAIGGPVPVPSGPAPEPKPSPLPTPQGGIKISDLPPVGVLDVLSRHCLACHSGPAEKGGGFAIFAGADNPKLMAPLSPFDLIKIDHSVYSGDMPPDGNLVSGEDYATLRGWINGFKDEIYAAINASNKASPIRRP